MKSALFLSMAAALLLTAEAGAAPSIWQADLPGNPVRRLKALTSGKGLPALDFGDPSAPDLSEPGKVKIYTTGQHVLVWEAAGGESAVKRFLRAEKPRVESLSLFHSDGKSKVDPELTGEDAWDPSVYVSPSGEKFLYAGMMSPTDDRVNAIWPDDHWNRRVHQFHWQKDRWVMSRESIFGPVPEMPTWLGHNYGHSILRAGGRDYFFYERVSEEKDGLPWLTEMFFQELISPEKLDGQERRLLHTKGRRWLAIRRASGGALTEGPRAFTARGKIFVAFSAGDYAADKYGIHLLWADSISGGFKPVLDESGHDLKDFGREVEKVLPLSWGAARPAFFEADGEWWVLFHGIEEGGEDSLRNVYLAPVEIGPGKKGVPDVRIFP
jgi:hypothetical protein